MDAPSIKKITRLRDSEESLLRKVTLLARVHGYLSYHTFDSRRSASGFPDIVLVRPPRVIFAELKSATGSFSRDQLIWLDALNKCPGVELHRWRPADLEQIAEVLR